VKGRSAVVRYFLLFLLFSMGSASAFELERAAYSFAQELDECAAYYLVCASLVRGQQPELAEKTNKQTAVDALGYSMAITDKAGTRARSRASIISMHSDLKSGAVSLSTLSAKYADQCAKIMDNPVERAHYWQQKQD
jgi:hypothetical protein